VPECRERRLGSDVPSEGRADRADPSRRRLPVKYVILIHANPDPWGHPTSRYNPEGRALPATQHDEMDRQFDGWSPEGHLATDGPYAEAKEQLAGFFLIDCASRERAEEIAAQFAQPGGTVELRPVMWPAGDDQ
jgi:hypothetical protein